MEPVGQIGLTDGGSAQNGAATGGQTFLQQILMNGDPELRLKCMYDIGLAQVKRARELIQGQWLRQVLVDVGQQGMEGSVAFLAAGLLDLFRLVEKTGQGQQEFFDIQALKCLMAISGTVGFLQYRHDLGLHFLKQSGFQMMIETILTSLVRQIAIVRRFPAKAFQIFPAQP